MIPECVAQWGSSCWRRSASLVVALPKIGMQPLAPLACRIQRSNFNQSKYLWHRNIYRHAFSPCFCQADLKVHLHSCSWSLWMKIWILSIHPSSFFSLSVVRYNRVLWDLKMTKTLFCLRSDTSLLLIDVGHPLDIRNWKKHLPAIYFAVNSLMRCRFVTSILVFFMHI